MSMQRGVAPWALDTDFTVWICCIIIWVVVSKIFYFYPYLGKISKLTNMFQMGWNHQPVIIINIIIMILLLDLIVIIIIIFVY